MEMSYAGSKFTMLGCRWLVVVVAFGLEQHLA